MAAQISRLRLLTPRWLLRLQTAASGQPPLPAAPAASAVLTAQLQQRLARGGHWTSYFVPYNAVVDDQRGQTTFLWPVAVPHDGSAAPPPVIFKILRTGAYPLIKYHCTPLRTPAEIPSARQVALEDRFWRALKLLNLGLPCLLYGLAGLWLIRSTEDVVVDGSPVTLYFLLDEDPASPH